ncbi:hypothetical protein [Niabella hirudinis]|uniref:hypothetical protein n=1 Tax=Niabella hirudinis TaxID=1285929 RepID=UPI003EB88D01
MQLKTTLIAILILVTIFSTRAQDVIIKNDKTELKAKVLEILSSEIKYKKWEMQDGPTYSINKSEVFMIIYKNGQRESFASEPIVNKPSVVTQEAPPQNSVAVNSPLKSKYKRIELEGKKTLVFYDYNNGVANRIKGKQKIFEYIYDLPGYEKQTKAFKKQLLFPRIAAGVGAGVMCIRLIQFRGNVPLGDIPFYAGCGIGLGGALAMPALQNAFVRKFVRDYNLSNNQASIKIGITNHGVGMALNF